MNDWLTTKEVAELLGCAKTWVTQLARRGVLHGEMRRPEKTGPGSGKTRGQQWFYSRAEVERYQAQPRTGIPADSLYISIEDAAKRLSRSVGAVLAYCNSGKLQKFPYTVQPYADRKPYCSWYVLREEVESLPGRVTQHRSVNDELPEIPASIEERAWFAGFFDGEGCVSIYQSKNSRTHILKLSVPQCHSAVMLYVQDRFGGRVYRRPRKPPQRQQVIWWATNDEAAAVLTAILPWLRVKREQAEIAIAFRERQKSVQYEYHGRGIGRSLAESEREWRDEQRQRIMALNHVDHSLGFGEEEAT